MHHRHRHRIAHLFHEHVIRPRLEWRISHVCERDDGPFITRVIVGGWFQVGEPTTWTCGLCGRSSA